MKKLFLILVMTATAATAFAQSQLSTVRGKTKEGKTIKVDYYQGTVEDVIQSVKYQLVDELQAEVKSLQNQTKTLQGKVDEANNQWWPYAWWLQCRWCGRYVGLRRGLRVY